MDELDALCEADYYGEYDDYPSSEPYSTADADSDTAPPPSPPSTSGTYKPYQSSATSGTSYKPYQSTGTSGTYKPFRSGATTGKPTKRKRSESDDDDDDEMIVVKKSDTREEEEAATTTDAEPELKAQVTDHYMKYTSYLQKVWVGDVLDLLGSPTNAPLARVCLLTGCAGSGKTYAINLLREAAGPMCNVTASTLNAAGIHADSRTIHSYMGFNTTELLDLNASDETWFLAYKERHKESLNNLQKSHRAYIANPTHECESLRMRCMKCQKWMDDPQLPNNAAPIQTNVFSGPARTPLLIIDEYGMLTGPMLARVLIALKLWAPPGDQHLVAIVGSVTQLQPGRGPEDRDRPDDGLWTFSKWDQVKCASFNLPFSVRSIEDPEYSECLDMVQHNVSTVRFQEIMQSRVRTCEEFDFYTPRIMHQDNAVRQLNESCMKKTVGAERIFKPKINHNNVQNPDERRKFAAVVRQRFKHIDFFQGVRIKVGSLVCVLKYQTQVFEGCLGIVESVQPVMVRLFLFVCLFDETMVTMVNVLCCVCVQVRSLESQKVHSIGPSTFNFDKMRTVEFMPLKLAHGMNTYFCQGLTFKFPVVYCPPNFYASSPIKPSCYVVCTRVTNRGLLNLTNCSFANTITGQTYYFSPECVRFKLDFELGYRLDPAFRIQKNPKRR
ncbi:putative helicase-primase helicase subunit [Cyprinid herpesvirus 2]|nr:putative helicase-primase helicase subunit [Cyprinid herpesvirus 2]AFJ20501.1 putative helicase-primase helicase subunit [Cyprinid herpesvirus 2]